VSAGIKVSGSVVVASAREEVDLAPVPDPYVAYLKALAVSSGAPEATTVAVLFYNGSIPKPVLQLVLLPGQSVALSEDQLPQEACPTKISVSADNAPVLVSFTIELV